MSCSKKTQDNCVSSDAKLQDQGISSKETSTVETNNKSNGTPPIPMIPDDDMDESEEGFPLITSVFSLASESSDSQKNPEKKSTEATPSNDTSPSVSVTTSGSPTPNGGGVSPRLFRVLAPSKPKPAVVDNKPCQQRDNSPYYLGKAKLILPKPLEENKTQGTLPISTMTFSQMMSFSPQNNNTINSTTRNAVKESTASQASGMMTRSAAHKINSQPKGQVGNSVPGTTAPAYKTLSIPASSTSQPHVVNLANSVHHILTAKKAPGQVTFPVFTPHTSSGSAMSSSVLSASSPLAKLIKSISPNSSLTNVSPSPATTAASSTHTPVVVTPITSSTANAQVRSARHINIAPAPVQQIVASTPPVNTGNTPRFVVVPKTGVSTPTIPGTQGVSTKGGINIPARVVMVPNTASPQGTTQGQVLYLVGNQGTGDGKAIRLFIPDRKATAGQTSTTVPSQNPVTIVSSNNGSIVSHTQLVRIIPKPATPTLVVNQQPKVPVVTQTSTPTGLNLNVNTTTPVLSNGSTTVSAPIVASRKFPEKSPAADKSSSEIPTSPSSSEEAEPSVESMDTGLSPHEARIQKLKELLKKQEEAIDRLKEKRQKEIDHVRAPPVGNSDSEVAATKRDSPFVVPLPPKKARLEQYRSKLKEANTTVKDGFLPNTDDTQFVKLVGLEKVVDKLKAKKLQELKESQALTAKPQLHEDM